jgi:hypothetical protein
MSASHSRSLPSLYFQTVPKSIEPDPIQLSYISSYFIVKVRGIEHTSSPSIINVGMLGSSNRSGFVERYPIGYIIAFEYKYYNSGDSGLMARAAEIGADDFDEIEAAG